MQPGWYPDPYSNGYLRWWDGAQWTPHTAPLQHAAFAAEDPQQDLAREQVAARRASWAVLGTAVIGVADALLFATVFASKYHDYFDQLSAYDNGTRTTTPQPPNAGWNWLAVLVALGFTVLFMYWLYRAAQFARKARLPAARDPVWAFVGFIVPVVNFWFPYQVARDTLAPGDPRRRLAAMWWTWYLIATLGGVVVLVVAIFSEGAGLVLVVLDAAAYGLMAAYARKLIAAVGDAHEELARHL